MSAQTDTVACKCWLFDYLINSMQPSSKYNTPSWDNVDIVSTQHSDFAAESYIHLKIPMGVLQLLLAS